MRNLTQACRANDVSFSSRIIFDRVRDSFSSFKVMVRQVTDMVILTETRGKPDGLIVSHLPFGPTAYFTMMNVVMRHDVPDR